MKTITGELHPKSISRASHSSISTVLEYILLFSLGALAITLHAKMRVPLRLPGHHGLEFMGLLVLARSLSKKKIAATISGLGVGLFALIPWMGFKDPFMPIVFFLPAVLLDLGFRFANFTGWKNVVVFGIIAAIAHFSIPISRTIIMFVTGYPYGSLKTGLLYPYALYIMFGFFGGTLGASIYQGAKSIKRK